MDKKRIIEFYNKFAPDGTISIVSGLIEILKEQEEFKGDSNIMISRGASASGFQTMMVSNFIADRANKVGIEQALDELEKVLSIQKADIHCIMVLRGIDCQEEIKLTEDVSLVPLQSLPDSSTKDLFLKPAEDYYEYLRSTSFAFSPYPLQEVGIKRAALVKTITLENILYNADEFTGTPHSGQIHAVHQELDEVRLSLTATGLCCPLSEVFWQQYEDEALEAAAMGTALSYSHLEIMPRYQRVSGRIAQENTDPIVQPYLTLRSKYRETLATSLKRLNQAMCRSSVGDQAVDLSIALECLLLSSERGDNRFKVALRTALVAFDDLEQRKRCRAVMRLMYDIRSALVHEGEESREKECSIEGEKIPAHKVLEEAIEYAVLAIQNLIKHGSEPDWYSLELSGEKLN
jgi:hypothetical protein